MPNFFEDWDDPQGPVLDILFSTSNTANLQVVSHIHSSVIVILMILPVDRVSFTCTRFHISVKLAENKVHSYCKVQKGAVSGFAYSPATYTALVRSTKRTSFTGMYSEHFEAWIEALVFSTVSLQSGYNLQRFQRQTKILKDCWRSLTLSLSKL